MIVPMATVEIMVNKIDSKEPPLKSVKNPVVWYKIKGAKVAKVTSPPIAKAIMNPVNVRNLALGPTLKLG
jgi:hypothetical protein